MIERVLGWSADLDHSTVEYTLDEHGPLVSEASVAIVLGTPLTFMVEDQQETIASATATLTRDATTEALTLTASVTTTTGVVVNEQAKLAEPSRSRPLDQYLDDVAMDPASRPNLTLGTLLSALVGAEANAEEMLMRAPSFIAKAGIAEWLLDHASSEVETQKTLSGEVEVLAARIVAQTPSGIAGTVEGLVLAISDVALTVTDARLPSMEATLEASAARGQFTLEASSVLSDEDCPLELSLPGAATLAQLVALLPGSPNLGALMVPLANQTLSALSFSSPGIVLRQPGPGAEPYELAEVYGTVSFSGWQSVLPTGWPAPSSTSMTVRVLSPLDAEARQLALAVAFEMPVGAKTLTAELSGEPLPESPPVWAYTLSVYSDPTVEPCTASEVLSAVGLGGPLQSLSSTLPTVGEVSSKLALGELTAMLEVPATGASTIGSLTVGLAMLEGWEIVPKLLKLGAVQVEATYEDGAWSGEASADAVLGGAYPVSGEIVLPTPTSAGAISFSSANPDLTIAKLIEVCGLGDLSQVPVLGTLLSVAVTDVELQLVYQTGATQPSLAAVGFSLAAGEKLLGWLQLSSLSLEVERRLLGQGGKPEPSTSFWLEAQWGTTILASLLYDSAKAELGGRLRMTGPETLADLLSKLLGTTIANALLPLIGQFAVRDGSLTLSTADFSPLSFSLRLDTSAALKLGTATIAELSVQYAAAKGKEPASYRLLGTLSGSGAEATIAIECEAGKDGTVSASIESMPGTAGLTARGLLGMLGLSAPTVLEPVGAPKFFDLKLTHASATFGVAGALQLKALSVSVVSTGTLALLSSPAIALTGLALEVDYDSAATPTTTGFVCGQLQVGPALVTVKYVVGKDGEAEFQASLEPSGAQIPDFAALISSGAYHPGYGLPADLGIPAQIPMARLTAVARPGKFVEVAGYKDTTAWPVAVGSLTIDVLALGGRVKVQAPEQTGGPATYEAALFGQLSFNGFVSTSALFTFGSNRNSVLSASASSGQPAIQLPAIAGALGAPWTEVIPAATAPISFGSAAYVYVDLTSELFALYGSLAGLGSGALLSAMRSGLRSYVFVCGLAQPFTFASLWSMLAPVDDYVRVSAANAAVLAYDGTLADLQADLASVAEVAKLQNVAFDTPFADLPALGAELAPTTPLPRGFALFAALDLEDGKLTHALDRILEDGSSAPSLLLWATIDHTTPANTTYVAELSELVLLGGRLTLDGTASYRPSAEETLVVDAHVGVALTAGGAPYKFHGTLTVAEAKTTFVLAGDEQPASIADPFGGMFGVTIASPRLSVEYEYPAEQATSSTISISGTVTLTIAGKQVPLVASVHFLDGVPLLAVVALGGEMSVLDLFADIVTGAAWPSGYAPIVLLSGSMYYANIEQASIEVAGKQYLQGYHVACEVEFFGAKFQVDVGVSTTGVLVSGAYLGEVDLVIAQLTPYVDSQTKQPTQGPTVTIDTRQSTGTIYQLACGISVFKQPFLETSFSYQPALGKYAGKAKYKGEIVGVKEPSVSFTYSDSEGLRIVDWPLEPVLGSVLDYAKMLEEASEGKCGKLVGLAFDKAISTSFSLELSQEGSISGGKLPLVLTGAYTVTVAGKQLFTLQLPPLQCSIKAPESFELEGIAAWVAEALVENAVSIGRSLLLDSVGNQKALKILIAEFAVTSFAPELLTNLICREADADNVKQQTQETIDEQTKVIEDPESGQLQDVVGPATSATEAAELGEAAADFAAAAGALGVLGATVAALVALIAEAWDWLTQPHKEDKKKAEADHETAQLAVEAAHTRIVGLIAMTGRPTGSFKSETAIEVSFAAANLPAQPGIDYGGYANFSFAMQVASDAKFANVLASTVTSALAATLEAAALASAEEAYVRVRAIYTPDPHNTFEGAWIEGEPCQKRTLLELVQSDWKAQKSAAAAATDALARLPSVGPAQLFDTLIAAGYAIPEARSATAGALPSTSTQQLAAIVNALKDQPTVARLLVAEGASGATIVSLCAAIYHPVAVALAIALKQGVVPEAGLAMGFAAGFPITLAQAQALIGAVYTQSWQLGRELHAADKRGAEAVAMLREAYAALVLVQALATLKAGGYQVSDPVLESALKASFSPTAQQYAEALDGASQDSSGDALALQLHSAGVARAEASSYVAACWSALTQQQVAAAIAAAYGPSSPSN